MKNQNTIVAIATPCGNGGVGVIRLSGPDAKRILKEVWKSEKKIVDNFASHRLYLGIIVDSSGKFIDKGLGVWMRAPHSYTGEEVVEIHGHGSPFLLDKILQACLDAGARLAEPGEFTKRAYLNGKMDLAQAEAVADVIAASSEMALLQAREHLSGQFSKKIAEFQEELVRLRAFVEASIDFPEEDIEFIQKEGILARMQPIQVALSEFLGTYHEGRLYREGIKTVLVGRPNVGKSSLLNALARRPAAIVSAQAGTTRDVVEVALDLGGLPVVIADTAGLRDAGDAIEAEGVRRARDWAAEADLKLLVSEAAVWPELDPAITPLLDDGSLLVLSKADLAPSSAQGGDGRAWPVSAVTGAGIEALLAELAAAAARRYGPGAEAALTRPRHRESVAEALTAIDRTLGGGPAELVAEDLRLALRALGRITGQTGAEDLLEVIFRDFCIGK